MKRVLITGASSGIGRLAVTAFLRRGWAVMATMRRAAERRDALVEEAGEQAGALEVLSLDVADAGEREGIAGRVRELDCLINNAGYGLFGALEDVDEEQLRRQLEVNFVGAALLTRALLPALRASGGLVLFVSSVLGQAGFPLTSAYCASKFAMEGLAESLYYELQPVGVRVGIVQPGGRKTSFGANTEWATGASPAFAEATQRYRALVERTRVRGGARSGDAVVRALVRLAEARRVPLRTRVGMDAAAMKAATVLPEGPRTRLFGTVWRRALAGRKRPV